MNYKRFESLRGSLSAVVASAQITGAVASAALAVLALQITSPVAYAQSNAEGGIFGRVVGATSAELTGATATVVNKENGFSRTISVSPAGTFEASGLPIARYEISLKLTGREAIAQAVGVSIGSSTTTRFDVSDRSKDAVKLEKFVVSGQSVSPVDVTSTEIGLNIDIETVKMLPVARDLTSVALLTPGVLKGDSAFGNLASFGGASVAENAYYLNGFNITDFRRGLGFGTVPFEFFQDFNVKTTGYSAEFGRSTGGVVNAISKRGSNTYKASASIYWEPKDLGETSPDSYRSNGTIYIVNSLNKADSRTANLEFSGPIVKDKLFFYGLYNIRDNQSEFENGTTQFFRRRNKDPFYALKLDWQIFADHAVEFTTFGNSSTTVDQRWANTVTATNYQTVVPATLGANLGNSYSDRGGRTGIARYSGRFFENLSISGLVGTSNADASNRSDASGQPYIIDNRTTSQVLSGVASITEDVDTRNVYRADGSYTFDLLGSHKLRFGYDKEDNKAHSLVQYSGDIRYTYLPYTGGALANSATPPAGTTQVAEVSRYRVGGDFRVITEALYIEDTWKLFSDRLVATAGLRNESFDNRNGQDKSFIKVENQLAPRLAAAFDVKGDGLSKIFGTWGRYFLQIPANTNVRLSGGETFYTDYYVLNSLKPDNTPNLGAQVGNRVVTGTGVIPEASYIVDANIGPMYQDEFSIGYERALGKKWKASVTGVFRDLKQVIEDAAIDAALLKYAKSKGYNKFDAGGFDYYVLVNPGSSATIFLNFTKDMNGDGIVDISDQSGAAKEQVTLPGSALGYPKATRKYYALEFKLDREFDGKWFAKSSYVWSHGYGNYEGSVYSDIGQTDAGLTQLFDQPGLADGTYGDQPNDRRHQFKINGGYQVAKEWLVTGSATSQSGRAISALGLHPTDVFARAYGASSYYNNGVLVPRGSRGRTPWVNTLDLGVKYKPKWGKDKISFGMDVFNVFNWSTTQAVYERAELSSGAVDTRYKATRSYQTPRYFRFSMTYDL